MNKKAAIQLSANFLVMMIIAIVVFSFSIYFIKKVFTGAETTRNLYDQRIEKEIEKLLDDGSMIAIPFDKKTIYSGEFNTFGLGVLNVMNTANPDKDTFKISITFNKAFDKSNTEIGSPPDADSWLQTTQQTGGPITHTLQIKNNEQEKFLLGVAPTGAEPGTYIFDMVVCTDDENDDNDCYDRGDGTLLDRSSDCPNSCPNAVNNEIPDLYGGHIKKLYVEVP